MSAESLMHLLNNVLDLSKIESGRLELEMRPFQPEATREEVVQPFIEMASAKGMLLSAVIAPDLPEAVLGDPYRVKQILSNLLSNAVKFTERGTIFLSLTCEPSPANQDSTDQARCRICYAVSDTGVGIARATGEKLFAPFTQADNSTTRKFGGTGLGLVIIRELAQRMEGEVGFESEEGCGSTFWFRQSRRAPSRRTAAAGIVARRRRARRRTRAARRGQRGQSRNLRRHPQEPRLRGRSGTRRRAGGNRGAHHGLRR
jgi:two-component system sensor histidine kinase/response regulator